MTKVIKKNGRIEDFDPEKLELTCIRAALNSRLSDERGINIGKEVLNKIKEWIKDKEEVASNSIFDKTIEILNDLSKDVAFMYNNPSPSTFLALLLDTISTDNIKIKTPIAQGLIESIAAVVIINKVVGKVASSINYILNFLC